MNIDVRSDLRGWFEAAMASGTTNVAVRGNMQMDTRVIKSDFKSEVRRPLRPFVLI